MSSYCSNCGNLLPDNAAFCPNCGTARKAAPAEVTPPAQAPAAPQPTPAPAAPQAPAAPSASGTGKLLANPKKLLIPVIAVIAVVAIVIAVMSLSGGGKGSSYEDAIDNYFSVHILGNISRSKVKALAPAEYWEYMEDVEDEDFDSYYADIEEDLEDYLDELEDQFGKNIKVTFKVTKEKEISKKKLGYIAAYLDDEYDIDEDDVTAAYELDLEYTVKGSEDDYDNEVEGAYVIQIAGKWYVVSVDLDEEDTTVEFLV